MLIVSVCMELEILSKTNISEFIEGWVGSGVGANHQLVLGFFFFTSTAIIWKRNINLRVLKCHKENKSSLGVRNK